MYIADINMIKVINVFGCTCIYLSLLLRSSSQSFCTFNNITSKTENDTLYRLLQLHGKTALVTDRDENPSKYSYSLCFCCNTSNQSSDPKLANSMIVQKDLNSKAEFSLARFNETQLAISGHNWILLTFTGAQYSSHCHEAQRRSFLMLVCDENKQFDNFRFISEDKDTSICHYLFEAKSKYACENLSTGLSASGIFCIVFFTILLSYFIFGFLYQRFIVGAKGMEQIPNFSYWHDFGNLQADGCDFICRSGSRYEPRAYKGIGDDRLRDDEPVDDHLLPM